jgi:hypothetical protein
MLRSDDAPPGGMGSPRRDACLIRCSKDGLRTDALEGKRLWTKEGRYFLEGSMTHSLLEERAEERWAGGGEAAYRLEGELHRLGERLIRKATKLERRTDHTKSTRREFVRRHGNLLG